MDLQSQMLEKQNMANASPRLRPMPTFFIQETTFSTKKVNYDLI